MKTLLHLTVFFILWSQAIFAQFDISVVAEDLINPIGVQADRLGNIWIAENGTGNHDGALSVLWRNGNQERVVDSLPSVFDTITNEIAGPLRVFSVGENHIAFTAANVGSNPSYSIIVFSIDSLRNLKRPKSWQDAQNIIPLGGLVLRSGYVESNPYSFISDGCDIVFSDAAANSIFRWNGLIGLKQLVEFPTFINPTPIGPPMVEPVPTKILSDGEEGYIMAQLTGFPFVTGAANIYRINGQGEYKVLDSQYTMVTDMVYGFDDESLLILEYATFDLASTPPFLIGSSNLIYLQNGGKRDTILQDFGPASSMTKGLENTLYITEHFTGRLLKLEHSATSISHKSYEDPSFRLYPNPLAFDQLNVEIIMEIPGHLSYEIVNVLGQIVFSGDFGDQGSGLFHSTIDFGSIYQSDEADQALILKLKTPMGEVSKMLVYSGK